MLQRSKNVVVNYFQESYQELRKVTWPTRNQAVRLTFIVLGFCLAASLAMGVVDLAFNRGYLYLVNYAEKIAPITTPVDTSTSATAEPLSITPSAEADTPVATAESSETPASATTN